MVKTISKFLMVKEYKDMVIWKWRPNGPKGKKANFFKAIGRWSYVLGIVSGVLMERGGLMKLEVLFLLRKIALFHAVEFL
ncbi:Uncharacterized protein TCM_008433 [Theobroma cacao]|uniref:Uncharacterized protein n=1 Tax=Theobroma cacao TaxID=3641 RepID=A0A061E3X1_THECC|nr:Uncharacterized protein TCM_008433 [Theobroma cacao]